MPDAHAIQEQAYAALDAWIAVNDPDGVLSLLEQIDAYAAEYEREGEDA